MSSHYGKTIALKRVYYSNSDLVNAAVAAGVDADMSEPYYYLSGFHDSKPRIEALHFSCVTVATSSAFSSTISSAIKSMDELYSRIVAGPNRKVGFIGAGNFDAVSHLLPANVEPVYITDSGKLEGKVDDGTLLASYISEGESQTTATRRSYATGVISPRVALFRKDIPTSCNSQKAVPIPAPIPAPIPVPNKDKEDNEDVLFVIVIILASVVLLMTCIVGLLICKERSGSPLFAKPLLSGGANGQTVGNSNL
jgi:hypothetical protein